MTRAFIWLLAFCGLFPNVNAQIGFEPYQAIATQSWPETASIADVNNDGLKDVVMGTAFYFNPAADYKIYVFLQNINGTLNAPVIYPYATSYPGLDAMTIADVNNDSRNDIIIGFSDSIGIYFQNSSGTLDAIETFYSGKNVYSIKAGDLNSDGLTDIVASHWNDAFIRVFYQVSTGGYNTLTYAKPMAGYDEVDIGDLNSDGKNDVVFMAGQGFGGIHIFTQNPFGILNSYVSYFPPTGSFSGMHGIAVGDLNNDGRMDIAASKGGNSPSSGIYLWFQDSINNNLISPPQVLPAYDIPEPIEIADLNCDGRNEIITVHGGWSKLSYYEQDDLGQYGSYIKINVPYASHYNPLGLSIGDYNNDDRQDIAIADYNSGLILLRSKALPESFDSIDTIVVVDTTYTINWTQSWSYTQLSQVTSGNYLITITDSITITDYFQGDSIRTDSIFIRSTVFCNAPYSDTLFAGIKNYQMIQTGSDTIIRTTRDSINLVQNVLVFPNPAQNFISFDLPSPFDMDIDVTMYDISGRLILRKDFAGASNRRTISLYGIAQGEYILNIGSKNYSDVVKCRFVIIE